MIEELLLSRKPNDKEKYISDIINSLMITFIADVNSTCFRYARFYYNSSNDPNGFRIIFAENMGFILVHGDGDKGLGWYIDGKHYSENIHSCCKTIKDEKLVHTFIPDINDFLNTIFKHAFRSEYTSQQFWDNQKVKYKMKYILSIANNDGFCTDKEIVDIFQKRQAD